jgi:hypothetical protein
LGFVAEVTFRIDFCNTTVTFATEGSYATKPNRWGAVKMSVVNFGLLNLGWPLESTIQTGASKKRLKKWFYCPKEKNQVTSAI